MNRCNKCNVDIYTDEAICPLCHNTITLNDKNSIYPVVKSKYIFHDLLNKIAIFLTALGSIGSILVNYIINERLSWSIFVVLGLVSFWLTLTTGIKRRSNFMRLLFGEIIVVIFLSFVWDYYTGFHKWSLSYVLPFLTASYTILFLILRIFTNHVRKEYILYTYINSLIGIIPMYSILKDNLNVLWPSYLSVFTSIFALIFLIVFNNRTLGDEMERRLHI